MTVQKFLFCLLLSGTVNTGSAQKQITHPNVIVILADDQGSVDMGVYGATDLQTPHMDRLAARGVRFTQFNAGAPICSPSRACLLTGKTPLRAGVPGNISADPKQKSGLPTSEITMAEMLKDAGYKTALIGKWHLGYLPELQPNAQGFDHQFGHFVGCIDNWSHFFYWNGPNRHDLYRNGVEVYYPGKYFPDLCLKEATEFIKTNRDGPFFLYYAMNLPHYPYQGSSEWLDYYNEKKVPYPRNLYNAFVSTMDDYVGKLLGEIEALGLLENTIVIFQSDHGHSTEERAHFGGGNSGPYRGAKASLFEGGLRVPAIISWPGKIPEGEVRTQWVVEADWFPTVAELCGLPQPQHPIDGKSMKAIIQDQDAKDNHDLFHWTFGKNNWAIRKGKWKLLFNPLDTTFGRNPAPNKEEDMLFLVNLEQDISEKNNLASQYPEIVQELERLHEIWTEN